MQSASDDKPSVHMRNACRPSVERPSVYPEMIAKWQKMIDLMAEICRVPAGLIMRTHKKDIEVFLSSRTEGNPYEKGEMAKLGTGLYCETVMKQRDMLLVPNALKDADWNSNPDIKLNMISYLGLPLEWTDGSLFGTICILDNKENAYTKTYVELVRQFQDIVNTDLALLAAHADIQTLSGLLPICASCKKIRDDRGFWNQIEQYIEEHSLARFSHGICPDCANKLYPGLSKDA